MKILPLLTALVALTTAATAPARANYAADFKLLKKFEPVLKTGDVTTAKKLIAAPNFRPMMRYGDEFYTLFDQVMFNDQIEIARLMMKSPAWKKTKWNSNNTAQSLLTAAAQPRLFPILVELSRQTGFDLNAHSAENGDIPLGYAAENDNMRALKWLVSQPRVRLGNRDGLGQTALHDAGTMATKWLLTLPKMDVNARDDAGKTALHVAVESGKLSKVRALLASSRVDPNIRDKSKSPGTALDLALRDNNPEISTALLANSRVRSTASQRASVKRMGQWTPQGDRVGP